jgi:SAM-dependent methyltransferase
MRRMNPWLALPLEDYAGHMGSEAVDQLVPLADLFAEALARLRPRSVAVLGVAGGNGLQHVDGTITSRVVGIDVNPGYLAVTRQRFPELRGLELACADLARDTLDVEPVALHAALVFEHAGITRCLDNAVVLVGILRTEVDCGGMGRPEGLQLRKRNERGCRPSGLLAGREA